jgi:hypothetical protein
MLTHETLPVSGASVVGMTIRVGQGQSHLPADVPGISTTLGQRDRLQLKGRLLAQPAKMTKLLQWPLYQKQHRPDKIGRSGIQA